MDLSRLSGVTAPKIKLTKQQQAVVNAKAPAVLVNAIAGSGKTSTLMELARKYDNGLYLAFNKAIVKDVLDKLPVGWSCKTFNAMGLAITKKHLPKAKVNFNKYKQSKFNLAVNLAQFHMCMDGNVSEHSWGITANRFSLSKYLINEAIDILKQGQADTTQISGEDMMQYPINNGWLSDKYDVVLVDECQDLNPQQISFLACIPTDKIVFVGDKNQAIYGFRGSDPEALNKIINTYAPDEFEMNESFRCPVNIIDKVNHIVPNMYSAKTGGQVEHVRHYDVVYDDECFILSRVNAKLIKLAYTFIKSKQHFSIGSTFIRQLEFDLKPFLRNTSDLLSLKQKIVQKFQQELNKAKQNKWSIAPVENKYEALLAIVEDSADLAEVTTFINSLKIHADGSSARKLMTIHAAKGLETDHVYFLDVGVIDYLKNKTDISWKKQEEDNLYYVACTRALSKLTFVNS